MSTKPPAAVTQRLDAIADRLPDLGSDLLRLQSGDLEIARKSNEFDLVTEADRESEERLTGFITETFPEDRILAEEGSPSTTAAEAGENFLWILDPIDGTTNFAHGLPIWGVSIGLMQASKLVGGLVAAPALNLTYRATLDHGATRNGQPIAVNQHASMGRGIIATGFPYDRAQKTGPICRTLEAILKVAGGIRRLGAASLDFCFLADGRFAGYYETDLQPWDYAAGSLIAREAGARLTDLNGEPLNIFSSQGVIASNGKIHTSLIEATAPLREPDIR
jgi:myo-inositol-1(or 4)-monophosphatase